MSSPEEQARRTIDGLLTAAGWAVQDFRAADLAAARGVAIGKFVLAAAAAFLDSQLHHQR